jgi:hypothetical protein
LDSKVIEMTDVNDNSQSIAADWPSRKAIIRAIEKTTPWTIEPAIVYNARLNATDKVNAPPIGAYCGVGVRLLAQADALALKCEPWEKQATDALGYIELDAKLDFFWHVQFRTLFKDRPRPLRRMDWALIAKTMALQFVLGHTDEAIYQGYLAHAILNRSYQLKLSYENMHRRVQAFMLRLFAMWRGDVAHAWPSYAFDEPIYERILATWRDEDPATLKHWLLAACNRHTHQAKQETEKTFRDCASFPRTPIEILYVLRLRQVIGLENPSLDHPLMEPPFDRLPEPQPRYVADDLVRGTLARIREDWPEFDNTVSLEALRTS